MTELAKPIKLVQGIISDLFGEQCDGLGEMKDEIKKAQRDVETWTHNVKMVRAEFAEAEAAWKKIAREASDKFNECERLDRDIKAKNDELNRINQTIQKQFQ
jgi:chromosome segregation ATPase